MRPMIECKKKRTEHKYLLLLYILIAACSSDTDHQTQTNSDTLYDNEIYNPKISIYQDKDLAVSSNSKKLIKDDGQDAILIGDVISRFFDDGSTDPSTFQVFLLPFFKSWIDVFDKFKASLFLFISLYLNDLLKTLVYHNSDS